MAEYIPTPGQAKEGNTPGPALPPLPVIKFLLGEAPLDGVWYGEGPPPGKPAFWWRDQLSDALKAVEAREADVERLIEACEVLLCYVWEGSKHAIEARAAIAAAGSKAP